MANFAILLKENGVPLRSLYIAVGNEWIHTLAILKVLESYHK